MSVKRTGVAVEAAARLGRWGAAPCAVLAAPAACWAAPSAAEPPPHGLVAIDWVILAVYGAAMLVMGWLYGRRARSMREYFVGSGRMNPIFIGVSLFATLLSTISYLSMPGEALGKGPIHLSSILSYPIAFLIVGYVLLPIYMRQRVTSAYELLEARLGLSVRLLAASMFILLRLVWMSLLVYLAAKAMAVIFGLGTDAIPVIVLGIGVIAVIYTSIGGLRAVVITDVAQAILLYGGALLVLGVVTVDLGGFSWFPTAWQPHWDIQPLFSCDLSVRATLTGTMLSTLIWLVCTSGGDQTSVQRFMATSDAAAARRAFGVQVGMAVLISVTLGLVGFALLGYFRVHPEQLPPGMSLSADADDIFPRFIAYHLPPGISGLVVAGMFAAAMSSLDSGLNSITAVVMTDFLDRFGLRPKTERGHVRAAQALAFGIGAVVVAGSSLVEHVPGNITAVTMKTANLLTPSIFCLFVFALFVPAATPLAAWAGALTGTAAAVLTAFSGPIFGADPGTGADPVSFQWIAPISVVVNMGTGWGVCLLQRGLGRNSPPPAV